ncbi:MAG: GDP-mannose 4,6-dehydratase [Actinobacteria bacterium]|nr:GDP-mannose 4,6-dehydratase [Actinomycetota bacterium]
MITGAGGFVGAHLITHLEASGDTVLVTDPTIDGLDITDVGGVAKLLGDLRPEVIYHLAGWADVGASWANPATAFRVNADGTLNVLLAALDAGVDRVLIVSSADVYGSVAEANLPITENTPLRPVSPYAASKVAADFLALQAFLGRGLKTLRVRAFNHLGPGQTDKFVASALASRIARNELDGSDEIPIGNLSARRDFTDVRDVVRAYRMIMTDGVPGEVYNVCSGSDVAAQELAEQLLADAERPMRFVTDPELLRPVDVPVLRGEHTRLTDATGWEPSIPLSRTLADLLDDWRHRLTAT